MRCSAPLWTGRFTFHHPVRLGSAAPFSQPQHRQRPQRPQRSVRQVSDPQEGKATKGQKSLWKPWKHMAKNVSSKKKTPAMCFYGFHVSMVFHGNKRIKQSNCSFTINCKRKKTVDHLHTGRPRVHAENPERELRSTGYPGPLERPTLMRFEKLLKEIRRPLQDVFD